MIIAAGTTDRKRSGFKKQAPIETSKGREGERPRARLLAEFDDDRWRAELFAVPPERLPQCACRSPRSARRDGARRAPAPRSRRPSRPLVGEVDRDGVLGAARPVADACHREVLEQPARVRAGRGPLGGADANRPGVGGARQGPRRLRPTAPFCVAIDPLDGSANLDNNISVGTIFSIRPQG